jgi:3-oxoacid CoA-transferase subunit A
VTTQARAAVRALQRVFQGLDMDLTLIVGRVGGSWSADLVASGLVSRVIAGSYGMVSPNYTGRLRQVARAHASGKVRFEHWSFWTLMQRLIAAAHGMPYALTHSLAGSSLAEGNPDWCLVPDPFDPTRQVGAVRALHPDLAILHVDTADEDGNAIVLPPLEEGTWGAKASRGGAIVTAERIVTRDEIARNAHLVKLPARYVRAVSHVPFGAHPGAFGQAGVAGFGSYGEDAAFSDAYVAATRDPAQLQAWVEKWITCSGGHEGYLEMLGHERLAALRAPAPASAAPETSRPPTQATATDNELLMVLALREVMRRTVASGCDVLLVGAGLSVVRLGRVI